MRTYIIYTYRCQYTLKERRTQNNIFAVFNLKYRIVPNQVSPDGGVQRFSDFAEMEDDLEKMSMSEHDSYSHVSAAYADILEHALRSTELLGVEMENIKLANDWKSCRKNKWGKQLEQIAKLMKLDTTVLDTERAAFVAKVGGYDTHKTPSIEGALKILNEGLECFVHELKAQKIFDNTAIVMVSEFGRSLITNTLSGTDHGWGGHYWLAGGAVKGGQILGKYPEKMKDVDVGRGKMQPSTPWEGLWNGIGTWWGLDKESMEKILPNAKNFKSGELLTAKDLFHS